MTRVKQSTYLGTKDILKFGQHSIQVSVMVDPTVGITVDGRKIAKAGTIVGGKGGSILSGTTDLVEKKNTQTEIMVEPVEEVLKNKVLNAGLDAEGVLIHDIDVTDGARESAMVIHGFVDLNKIPEAPCLDAENTLENITFLV